MKTCALLTLLLAPVAASSVSATAAAKAWLSSHQAPNGDQLGDLASSNPQAFAIVSALLNKRHVNTLSEAERGPNVFLKMMGPRRLSAGAAPESKVVIPYDIPDDAEAQPTIQDQMHYDPTSADDKDQRMTDGLLDAVARLSGNAGQKIALMRQRRHVQKKDGETSVDGPFGNPFGRAAPKPASKHVWVMSEEEKEQRRAAGLPLTYIASTDSLLTKQVVHPRFDDSASEPEVQEPVMQHPEAPKKHSALSAYLR